MYKRQGSDIAFKDTDYLRHNLGLLTSFSHHIFACAKRYAVTSTHLFADGQRYEWSRLKLAKKQPKRRIMLLRKGWGIFGPLPLGGNYHDLDLAKHAIARFYQNDDSSE